LVAETRTYFLGGIREQKNKLNADLTASSTDTSVALSFSLGPISTGAVITIGLERMFVWSTSNTSATVERGWDGTTIAAHTSGAIVSINSRCDDFAIFRAMNNELAALSAPENGLYRTTSVDITFSGSTYGYDLDGITSIIGPPLAVLARSTTGGVWDPIKPGAYLYHPSADASDFPSGRSIMFYEGYTAGQPIRVLYRAPFTALATLTDNVQTQTGLPATANDILPLGAALQLAHARPMKRADIDAQGSTRRAEEATTQDTLIASAQLRDRRNARINEEASRLAAEFVSMA
jgi:hypothetical protein